MNSSPLPQDDEAWKPAAAGCLWGIGTWVFQIGVAILIEFLLNSGSGPGAGSPGMAPIPALFLVALFLGWIPSGIAGFWNYRKQKHK